MYGVVAPAGTSRGSANVRLCLAHPITLKLVTGVERILLQDLHNTTCDQGVDKGDHVNRTDGEASLS